MGQDRKPNKYKGQCRNCGGHVPAEAGLLGPKVDGKFTVEHLDCNLAAVEMPATTAAAPEYAPTAEQLTALELFRKGDNMVIEAGAGAGKTSTLKQLAQDLAERRPTATAQFCAFNKLIVEEAGSKFPANTTCSTMHSLAWRAIVKSQRSAFAERLRAPRMRGEQVARQLGVDPLTVRVGNVDTKTLAAGFLGGQVMAGLLRYCATDDAELGRHHFPYIEGIDMPTPDGRRTFANNDEVASYLLPFARRAWADLTKEDGRLRFEPAHYLKMWQLGSPRIPADVIFFDEAQDASPVMASIIQAQADHAQLVYVGDSCQAINEWMGAVNALALLDTDSRSWLTQSFRFGPALADLANRFLAKLDAELRLVGTDSVPTEVGLLEHETAVLCRTNAKTVEVLLDLVEQGRRPHLVGGGSEVVSFAKGAKELQGVGHTDQRELACFASWAEVQDYVEHDAQGQELALLVRLIDKFGADTILGALDGQPAGHEADVVICTAHKSKGREWDRVRLGADFLPKPDEFGRYDVSTADLRLMYVAVTRAKLALDASALMPLFSQADDEPADEEADDGRSGEDALRAQGWRG